MHAPRQFVHHVELAHALGGPHNWARFRKDLLRARTATFGLDPHAVSGHRLTPPQHHTLQVLDHVRSRQDPATDWSAFFELLRSRRHAIRPDLP